MKVSERRNLRNAGGSGQPADGSVVAAGMSSADGGAWEREQWPTQALPRLESIAPLLPGGPNKRPLVGDGWQAHAGVGIHALQATVPECVCWHVGADDRHIAIDIDGSAAAAFCQRHGCDPYTADTWQIIRTGNSDRLKLVFRVTADQKATLAGGSKTVKIEGQELAVFAKPGHQIVVLGQHYTKESGFTENDDQYAWAGRAPAEAQPLPPEWFALLKGVFCGDRPLRPPTRRTVSNTARGSSSTGGDWLNSSQQTPCPVCGRDHSGACSISRDGDSVWCCHGEARSAPDCSQAGERVRGTDGRVWGYVRTDEHDSFGERSLFVIDKPVEPTSKASTDPTRAEVERRSFRELLADALAAIRRSDEDTEMEARAEIMGRFKRSDAQITAALFRLLTEQETGRPAGDAPHAAALDLDAVEGMDALVDGFMPANDLGLAYGAKGSGKTAAALGLSFAVIEGAGFLDHSRATEPGAVLFIASDSGAAPLKAEMQRMGLSDHPAVRGEEQRFYVWAYSAAQRTTAWCASINGCVELLQFVKAKGVRLVVIDSAKTICAKAGISYLDNDSIAALLNFMKETICAHASVLILSHDGTEKGSHSGAKAWAEVPSIVHNIQQIPDAPQERLWRVVKNRMGPLRELRYQLGEDGRLEPVAGVEVIGDASAAVLRVLAEAHERGVGSVSNKELVAEIGRRFRLAPKTVANTLTRMVGASKPEICRVSSKRGHYKLAPRLLTDPLKGVRFLGKEEGQTPVRERDLTSSRLLPEGRTREERELLPVSSHSPRVGKHEEPSCGNGSEGVSSRDIEMPMGSWLVELPPPATVGSGADAFGDGDDPHWSRRQGSAA
jgi:hypothetical protein